MIMYRVVAFTGCVWRYNGIHFLEQTTRTITELNFTRACSVFSINYWIFFFFKLLLIAFVFKSSPLLMVPYEWYSLKLESRCWSSIQMLLFTYSQKYAVIIEYQINLEDSFFVSIDVMIFKIFRFQNLFSTTNSK